MTTNRPTEHAPADCPVCKLRDKLQAETGSDHRPVVKTLPDLLAEGYGWPPADYRPWGETEKVIDEMIAEDQAAMAIGDPFDAPMSTGAGVEYPAPGTLGLVYLAGPMRGWQDFNFPAFHAAAKGLREQGWGVFNPAEMDEANGFDFMGTTGHEDIAATTGFDLRKALGADLDFITRRADAVAVLPGWEKSKGANAEVATARALGLPVFDAIEGPSRPIVDTPTGPTTIQLDESWGARWTEFNPNAMADEILAASRAFAAAEVPPVDDVVVGFDAADPSTMVTAKMSADGEVRTVSSTGGQKGVKLARYDLIPAGPLKALAEHFGRGAAKYDDHQWRKGYEWSKSAAAGMRHFWDFWNGADYDVCPADGQGCQHVDQHGEAFTPIPSPHGRTCYNHTGSHHLDAFMWHGFVLRELYDKFPEFDDRYKPEESA